MEELKEFFSNKKEIDVQIEELIVEHFLNCLNEEKMFKLSISTIYRLLHDFLIKNQSCPRQVLDFCFKCLEVFNAKGQSQDASVLFSLIEVNNNEDYYLDKLLNQYFDIFDPAFLHVSHVKYLYHQKIKLEEELKLLKGHK